MDVLERADDRQGVVHMEVGEPDFSLPAAAADAAVAAVRGGDDDYTSSRGTAGLRDAISDYYDETYGVDVPPSRILVTPGSSAGLLLAMLALVDPGDDVVLTDPYYACYPNFVRQAGGNIVTTKLDPRTGFAPDIQGFENAVSRDTAAMLVNSPANPTGAVLSDSELGELAALSRRTDTPIISDEVYHGLTYDGDDHTVLEYTEDAIVLDGVSKRYAMTGYRVGWMVLPPGLVDPINRLAQNLVICAPAPSQAAAEAAIRADHGWLDDVRDQYRQRRDRLVDAADDWGLSMDYTPGGAYYLLLDVSDLPGDAFDVADVFLDAGVAMTPGPDFGSVAEDTLRASYATSTEQIELAIERISGLLEEDPTLAD
ncbi:aspartate aminotransferase [Halocalculus aciditolerans]|uniref:Aminotransferase n=2 Tax=Halocalculus aciditolerans TaxID=1383812 RepID=A0A830F541_9EURY|nr:aspartate aminotransferase [Halocalculus aciditolerans]